MIRVCVRIASLVKKVYDLSNFIPFNGNIRSGEHVVLVWSQKTGYYFSEFGFVVLNEGVILIAQEK
jgi:hypothetical protein